MPTYTFTHTDGTSTTVAATDEPSARAAAMTEKHGQPKPLHRPWPLDKDRHTTIGSDGYTGSGLFLSKVKRT